MKLKTVLVTFEMLYKKHLNQSEIICLNSSYCMNLLTLEIIIENNIIDSITKKTNKKFLFLFFLYINIIA